MAVSKRFLCRALELLEPVGAVTARAMFGGQGLYLDGVMFGLLYDDALYLKTSPDSAAAFAKGQGEPFTYESAKGATVTSYVAPPESAFEDPEAMLPWARLALQAARAKKAKPTSARPKQAVTSRAAPSPRKRR